MKKIIVFCVLLFYSDAIAKTIDWYVDGAIYQTTTCNSGDNVTPPTPPEKYGYTFRRWKTYTRLQYLESTGTQYIKTNTYLDDNAEFFFDFMKIAAISAQDIGYSGPVAGGGWHGAKPIIAMWLGQTITYSPQITISDIVGKRCTEHWIKNGTIFSSELIVQDSQSTYTLSTSSATYSSDPITFLTSNNTWQSATRIYGAWLKDGNNNLVADFIPVLDPADVPCMYDRVTSTCFYNSGTGNFIAGPVIDE